MISLRWSDNSSVQKTYVRVTDSVNVGCEDLRRVAASRAQQDCEETVYASGGICNTKEDFFPDD